MNKKQLTHLEKRLLEERARVMKELGYYDESFNATLQSADGDLSRCYDELVYVDPGASAPAEAAPASAREAAREPSREPARKTAGRKRAASEA